eukprot:SM000070S21282  [mRNA]  locus=s70:18034:19862:+ [translate_table: standard]
MDADVDLSAGRFLFYSPPPGGGKCVGLRHQRWELLCALAEAAALKRTFVLDMDVCLPRRYNHPAHSNSVRDLRLYYDYLPALSASISPTGSAEAASMAVARRHLREVVPVVPLQQFLCEWRLQNQTASKPLAVRVAEPHELTKHLFDDPAAIIWRRTFAAPGSDDTSRFLWHKVCEASEGLERPWEALQPSHALARVATNIGAALAWNFDGVHVRRGDKAKRHGEWPNLDRDTQPLNLLETLQRLLQPNSTVYIATDERRRSYFEPLKSFFNVYTLQDFEHLWADGSEWYTEVAALISEQHLPGGLVPEFDGFMRAAVDFRMLEMARQRLDTFNDLTQDAAWGLSGHAPPLSSNSAEDPWS